LPEKQPEFQENIQNAAKTTRETPCLRSYTVYKGLAAEAGDFRECAKRPDWRVLFSSSSKNGEM
jgi:hypothetical protein